MVDRIDVVLYRDLDGFGAPWVTIRKIPIKMECRFRRRTWHRDHKKKRVIKPSLISCFLSAIDASARAQAARSAKVLWQSHKIFGLCPKTSYLTTKRCPTCRCTTHLTKEERKDTTKYRSAYAIQPKGVATYTRKDGVVVRKRVHGLSHCH